ncbi:IS110 family transposase [Kribbella sp. NPDC004536]|uniref:IS110 family transposase n=1 Tax=Kribbella sp. NPDC004536 TaxID=3364106 RepID=UPI0036B9DE5E
MQRRGAHRPGGTDLIGAWIRSPVTDLSSARPVRSIRQIRQHSPHGRADPSMTIQPVAEPPISQVIGGIDTHKHTHYAAVVDDHGQLLGHHEFRANDRGYRELLAWIQTHGTIVAIGVESTGSFGATLTRFLTSQALRVVEVNRPNRLARRMDGKSDRLDAEQIARAVLGQTSTAVPKAKSGTVEVIRTLRVTRASAVKARTQAFNTLWGVMIGAPSPLRDELVMLTKRTLVNRCLRLRPESDNLLALISEPGRLLMAGVKTALRDLARRWKSLDEEIKTLNTQIEALVRAAAPELLALHGVGVEIAGQFLVTAGDNAERIHSEAAFAKLCGVAPQPASSGRTTGRHRLSRSGDRAANSALYIVTIVRIRHHQATRDYVERRTAKGLSKREIIRCLKRYIAREIYNNLPRLTTPDLPTDITPTAA